jgi:magnesium-transporting ATPase (P-type)
MYDPPRKCIVGTVTHLQCGGVQIIVITSDGEETASKDASR